MRRKRIAAVAAVPVMALVIAGCGGSAKADTNGYTISGNVAERMPEVECDPVGNFGVHSGDTQPLDVELLPERTSGGSSGGSSGGRGGTTTGGSTTTSGGTSGSGSRGNTNGGGTSGNGRTATGASGGAGGAGSGTSSRRSQPEKISVGEMRADRQRITVPGRDPFYPSPGHTYPGYDCDTEWELYVRSGDDYYEQDVPQDHYDRCEVEERFPTCTLPEDD